MNWLIFFAALDVLAYMCSMLYLAAKSDRLFLLAVAVSVVALVVMLGLAI